MAGPSVTYTFTNGTVADASQMNQNLTDLINGLTDGTKDLNINALTAAGKATLNGAVDLGNATGDAITVNGAFAGTGGDASATQRGLVTTAAQSFAGVKSFNDGMSAGSLTGKFLGSYYSVGSVGGNSAVQASLAVNASAKIIDISVTGDYYLGAENTHVGRYRALFSVDAGNRIFILTDVAHTGAQGFNAYYTSGVVYVANNNGMATNQSGNVLFTVWG